MTQEGKRYDAEVEDVYSGDDLVLLVDLGVDGLYKKVRARLRGVDTPSAFKAGKDTEAGTVRDMVRGLVMKGKCEIELHSHGKGGWMVTLYVNKDGQRINVNQVMIDRGYVYHGKQIDLVT